MFAPEWLHINDFELSRIVSGTEFRRASFPCWKKHALFNTSVFFGPRPLGPGPMVQGPWGPWGPHFSDFLEICKMVRELSKSVPRVFRSPGNPFINSIHFIWYVIRNVICLMSFRYTIAYWIAYWIAYFDIAQEASLPGSAWRTPALSSSFTFKQSQPAQAHPTQQPPNRCHTARGYKIYRNMHSFIFAWCLHVFMRPPPPQAEWPPPHHHGKGTIGSYYKSRSS